MANVIGEKELKTSWDELTASDSTKRKGHNKRLIATKGYLTLNAKRLKGT